jgi:hypothetical protein
MKIASRKSRPLPLLWLTKKYEKKSFSQSFAEFNAESRKDKNLIINILRNSAVHQRDSARNKKELFRQPLGGWDFWW